MSDINPKPSITSARRYIDFLVNGRLVNLPAIPKKCVICYSADVIERFKADCPHTSISLGMTNPMQLHFFSPAAGSPFAIVKGMHGASMAAVLLEELIALRFEEFLVIGPAGHPTNRTPSELQAGDLVVVTEALIFEGTSPHYGQVERVKPAASVTKNLRKQMQHLAIDYRAGSVATTDALYRETESFINDILAKKILAIDMEISALFTVAGFHGVPLGALLFISDLVRLDGNWDLGLSTDHFKKIVAQLTEVTNAYVA